MKPLRSLPILFILLCLLAGMLSFAPARVVQAGPETGTPAGLSAADWAQIETLLSQQAYLKASNTGASDEFGYSVAISGDTVVVGAYNEDSSVTGVNGDENDNSAINSGAAYIFTRNGTTWSQEAYLKASNTEAGDNFGFSVAIDGDNIVVGAYGEDSASPFVNGDQNDNSTPNSGSVYVFTRSGTTWSQEAYLKSTTILRADMFGYSVAISGDTIVVGAYGEDSKTTGVNSAFTKKASLSGAAYVFTRSGTTWSQEAYLKASNTELGDYFGWSVAVSGDTVVVGAFGEDSLAAGINGDQTDNSAINSGAAYVFTRDGTTWSQQAYLKASNTGTSDYFGFSVAIDGDTVVIGAEYEDSGASGVNGDENDDSAAESGAAYVFTRDGTTWSQQSYLKASNTGASDQFGSLVAISGDTVVMGAPNEDSSASGVNGDQTDNSAVNSGAAYIFTRDGTTWSQQSYLKASNTGAYDYFGFSLAINGDTMIAGAPYEDSNASGVNGDQTDNSAASSGAAYSNFVTTTIVNHTPTAVTLDNLFIQEERPAGVVVGALSSTDPDAGDTATYSLVNTVTCDGADNGYFAVNGTNLVTSGAPRIDFQTKYYLSVCLRVTDSGGLTFDQRFTIVVRSLHHFPMDVNGDGSDDYVTFRPSAGTWHLRNIGTVTLGQMGDLPVGADYNGDGKADIAVFRPSATGQWLVFGQNPVNFGVAGDIPLPLDYNGDKKADFAVFRPSTSTWHIRGQLLTLAFGQAGDIPVPADYNGDGKADLAFFTPTTGTWTIRDKTPIMFGQDGDIPVPFDYNNDGKADIAVYRPSTGTWYVRGIGIVAHGGFYDQPFPMHLQNEATVNYVVIQINTIRLQWSGQGLPTIIFGANDDIHQ